MRTRSFVLRIFIFLVLVMVRFSYAEGFDIISESILYPSSEPETKLSLEGLYEKRDIPIRSRYPNGVEVDNQHTIITFKPLEQTIYGKSSLSIGKEVVSQNQKTIPFFLIGKFPCYNEFVSLLGKQVHIEGRLEQSNDLFFFEIPQIHLDYAVDSKWIAGFCETLPYEPSEITLEGRLYQETNPGPPEYMSIEKGDVPETNMILALEKPIHVGNDEGLEDEFNEPEKYVLELVAIPPADVLYASVINKKVKVKGTLFHAHTGHHHRRILCNAKVMEVIE
jgi:hypothetical protein